MMAITGDKRSDSALQKIVKALVLGWNFWVSEDSEGFFARIDGPEGRIQNEKSRGK